MEEINNKISELINKNKHNKDNNIVITKEQRTKRHFKEIPKLELRILNRINNLKKQYQYLNYLDLYRLIILRDKKREYKNKNNSDTNITHNN